MFFLLIQGIKINVQCIESIEPITIHEVPDDIEASYIYLTSGKKYLIKKTPDEIMTLIKLGSQAFDNVGEYHTKILI